ncbi:hypothetical protein HELRODRAFT_187998 [Helobdella robusta]|uniref:Phosphatidylinositol-4,5-bisphosphate 4-phosphatase n=1 Tax=Helobdella robusta TaxID=6412 RepID=T1FPJ1_HELRO|nr:hypothetical protein HELRODRAFT_187998 [Helobdella robusta]ESO12825.1 hypothetical protein HELRODRAFT_187998 [Helobdella robusta]
MAGERTPILASSSSSYLGSSLPYEVLVDECDADELPPLQFINESGVGFAIKCKVCQKILDLDSRTDFYVIQCDACQEATPVKPAPFGKKYVRCKCKCLLICKAGSKRVACPRSNCKLIMLLSSSGDHQTRPLQNVVRVTCSYCSQQFLFSFVDKRLARCPHCKKISSVGDRHNRKNIIGFLIASLLFLAAGCFLLGFTLNLLPQNKGLIAAYVVLFLVGALLLLRVYFYWRIKVSQIDSTTTSNNIRSPSIGEVIA